MATPGGLIITIGRHVADRQRHDGCRAARRSTGRLALRTDPGRADERATCSHRVKGLTHTGPEVRMNLRALTRAYGDGQSDGV